MKNTRKGFTLIELILVMAILGIIATLGITSYTTSFQKSRDAKRRSDLSEIMTALQLYYNDNGVYPTAGTCANGTFCFVQSVGSGVSNNPWIPALTSEYIQKLPADPRNDSTDPWYSGHSYAYGNVAADGQSFDLVTQLEWHSDPDICANRNYKMNGGTSSTYWCGDYSPYLYQIPTP